MSLLPRTPCLSGDDAEAKRQEIRAYFHATFDRYEALFESLASDEAFYRKPITLRHPLIFYYGHTATFFINKLVLAGLVTERLDPRFESMFAVGVDEMSWDDLNDSHYDWPNLAAVKAYRERVRSLVDGLMARLPLALPITWDHPWWVFLMGIEHERIHLETSSVLIRQHDLKYVVPHPAFPPCRDSGPAPGNPLLEVPGGTVVLGRERDDPWYGWDNEYGRCEVALPTFRASRHLVSNGEFLAFVADGGYADDGLWDEEGRAWRDFARASHPTFWVPKGEAWFLRLMLEEVAMPWDWPVEVNCLEARAFCRWLSARGGQPVRLPTEAEWYRLAAHAGVSELAPDAPARANLHLDHHASSCPVGRFRQGDFSDVTGNVWQWTETPIHPFDGFRVHPFYDDFTTPTFDGRHNLLKGGSWIACGNEARLGSRYAFRRHFFQHAGFRYVGGEGPDTPPSSHYETDKLLSEYAEFHYGDEYFGVANFPRALANLAIQAMGDRPRRRALDLGCAAGRASFELARVFEEVTGIDFSARFIGLGVDLARGGVLRYTLAEEGELVAYRERRLADLGLDPLPGKVAFYQGDACNLKPLFSGYDLILAANLIDRLYSPARFLTGVHERLNPGGLLLIASPYTWLTEHTAREEWIGGFKKDGENFTTLDGLKALLGPHFRLLQGPLEVPFAIRETRRKFQHSLSEVTIWERRESPASPGEGRQP